MQLFIHFGIYKTGSSYLQTLCANNRSHLEEFGYFFPYSVKDRDMMEGRITPGNGNGISRMTKKGDTKKCTKLIKKLCEQAKLKKCDKILISDEALIHAFASEKGLNCLYDSIKINQIESVSLFAFLRNPVDHCLSTYKHRAKMGDFPDFKQWVFNHYETPVVFKSFLNVFDKYPFKWKFAKYNRNESIIGNYFFSEWLGVPMPYLNFKGSINSSLTLAEIIFIQLSKLENSKTVLPLYDEFIKIKADFKAQNESLDKYFNIITSNYLFNYADVYEQLNLLIFNDDKIEIPNKYVEMSIIDYNKISYSKTQIGGILTALKKSYSFTYIMEFYKQTISSRVKRYLKSKF